MGRWESVKVLMVRAAVRNCGDARRTDILIMNEAGEFIWRSDAILRRNEISGDHSPAQTRRTVAAGQLQTPHHVSNIKHQWL